MTFLIITVSIIGILFMLTFMFIGIWLFIVALKSYNQLRYKNYILEKINEKLSFIANSKKHKDDDFIEDVTELLDISEFDNIKDFEKREHH
ncbi:hypothetical protein [uncultured Clostridium sp.]|uniref:hypothetical protein n=1 Tax=uncultured Clostridium sp. TaxID=59620 RepID=UPI00262CCE5D|nr:hypothetical protein [uncultured Clostridium sp.]